ncbi:MULTISPECIES: NAD(P)-dependent oxidoreductase [Actinosynnema]|uniref:NAD(P)-dependent oxidoreductase n=1 Tax=Actinosynnema TaxID=40566 RepID=UPI0020A2E889|nr:NAD(P)-dependent oxidoreductase [Actinosynnema pretiosum]MCP2098183.1 3-hydroxyisobutyrate dehydrogenase [Actinosynnema pretiosum]
MSESVAVLGMGLMGAGMARNLLRAGLEVRVWNRDPAKSRPLADDGARVASSAAEAVAGADVVLTMLFDAEATVEVMSAALPSARAGVVWAQCATVGVDGAARLAALAAEHGAVLVDAPVLGTRKPAEDGTLTVLAAGPESARAAVEPVFAAVASRVVWAGERADDGQRLKLVANSWVLSVTGATAQAVALARGLGVEPQLFLDSVAGSAVDTPYAHLKGRAMITGDFTPSFGIDGAVKDSALILEALAAGGTDGRLMAALHGLFADAAEVDGAADMAAVVRAYRT